MKKKLLYFLFFQQKKQLKWILEQSITSFIPKNHQLNQLKLNILITLLILSFITQAFANNSEKSNASLNKHISIRAEKVNPLVYALTASVKVVGSASLCGSSSVKIKFDILGGGTGPYTVVYRSVIGTGTPVDTTISQYTIGDEININQPSSSTKYSLVSVIEDSTGLAAAITGSAVTITTFNPVLGAITQPTCQTAAGSVFISSLPITPWTIKSSTGQVLANNKTTTTFTLPLTAGTNKFIITNAVTLCPLSFEVIINTQPSIPAAPVLNSQVLNCQSSFNQTWQATSNTTGYKLDIATDPAFTIFLAGYQEKLIGNTTSETIAGVNPGSVYYVRVKAFNDCGTSLDSNVETISSITTTYDNGTWSNGLPDSTKSLVFNSDYNINANMNACSCKVGSSANVTVQPDIILKLENELKVEGTLTFENNSSLVQVNEAVNTGNIIYKRNAFVRRYDLTFWSTPITKPGGFTLHDLSPNTLGDKFYSFNAANNSWVINYNGTLGMVPGYGYNVRAPQNFDINIPSDFTALFTGIPNNGNIAVNIVSDALNLLGNPYPSALDADVFIETNKNVLDGTLYFWTHNNMPSSSYPGSYTYNYSNDDYAYYNPIGGVAAKSPGTGATNSEKPLGKIGAAQSFFVTGSNSGIATFDNSMRTSGQNSQFFRPGKTGKTAVTERHRYWLNFTSTGGAFKQTLIGYITGATNNYDNHFDGEVWSSEAYVNFYSINSNTKLAIQGRALPFDDADTISLGYLTTSDGTFSIAIDEADGLFLDQAIYLEDVTAGIYHNLKNGPYTFTTLKGTFNNRFIVHYIPSENVQNSSTSKKAVSNLENNFSVIVEKNQININSNNEKIEKISVYDMKGSRIYENNNVNNTNFTIDKLLHQNQVIVVKTALKSGKINTQKVIF